MNCIIDDENLTVKDTNISDVIKADVNKVHNSAEDLENYQSKKNSTLPRGKSRQNREAVTGDNCPTGLVKSSNGTCVKVHVIK